MSLALRYKYNWKIEEAQKNILRTHTTAVSARMLYKLAQQVGSKRTHKHISFCWSNDRFICLFLEKKMHLTLEYILALTCQTIPSFARRSSPL